MRIFLSLIAVLLLAFSASGHPGKTDYRGGHKCWKNCGEWELRRAEYHLHDKDWKPIRLDSKDDSIETGVQGAVPVPGKYFLQEETAAAPDVIASEVRNTPESPGERRQTIVEKHHIVTVHEESLLPLHYMLLLLLAFLMLMILIFVRKKRERE